MAGLNGPRKGIGAFLARRRHKPVSWLPPRQTVSAAAYGHSQLKVMASRDAQLFGSEQTCHRGPVYPVHIPPHEGLRASQHRNPFGSFLTEEAMSTLLIVVLVLLVLGGGGWGYSRRRR